MDLKESLQPTPEASFDGNATINSISHSAEKSTENAKKVLGGADFDLEVSTPADQTRLMNKIIGELYGTIGGKSKNEVVDMLWSGLNSADIGERGKVALDVADYS